MGTPTIVVGDRMLRSCLPLDAMHEAVTEERG